MKKVLFTILLLLFSKLSFAQQFKETKVTAYDREANNPLTKASIVIVGTIPSSTSDINGNYIAREISKLNLHLMPMNTSRNFSSKSDTTKIIVLDTVLVIGSEKFIYSLTPFYEMRLPRNLGYLPATYLIERSPSSININYRGLLFNQVKILIHDMDIADPQTGHHNFNIPLNSLDISNITLKNQISFITLPYTEKLSLSIKGGINREKPFSLIEAKYKNLSLSYYNNSKLGRYYQISSFISDFGIIGIRRNEFDATGFFANPSILPYAYETTTIFLSAINYKNLKFLFRGHYDVFMYDYKKNDATVIKGLKNEHFSAKFQFGYSFIYYKREFLSSSIISKALNKLYTFRDFLILNPNIHFKNVNLSLNLEYWIDNKNYLIAPNLNINFGEFLISINSFSRYPNFTELYYQDPANISNPNLKPELYISPEISYENKFIIAKLFHRYNKNIIDWIYNKDSLKYFATNLKPFHSVGFEIFSKPLYDLQFGISIFKHLLSNRLSYKYLDNTPQFKFTALSKFFSFNILYNEKLSPKFRYVLDIHLSYKFLQFSIEDLFEQEYINEWIPPSRKIYLGISF